MRRVPGRDAVPLLRTEVLTDEMWEQLQPPSPDEGPDGQTHEPARWRRPSADLSNKTMLSGCVQRPAITVDPGSAKRSLDGGFTLRTRHNQAAPTPTSRPRSTLNLTVLASTGAFR